MLLLVAKSDCYCSSPSRIVTARRQVGVLLLVAKSDCYCSTPSQSVTARRQVGLLLLAAKSECYCSSPSRAGTAHRQTGVLLLAAKSDCYCLPPTRIVTASRYAWTELFAFCLSSFYCFVTTLKLMFCCVYKHICFSKSYAKHQCGLVCCTSHVCSFDALVCATLEVNCASIVNRNVAITYSVASLLVLCFFL